MIISQPCCNNFTHIATHNMATSNGGVATVAAKLVSFLGAQPYDVLNHEARDDDTMYKVGDVIIREHKPARHMSMPEEAPRSSRPDPAAPVVSPAMMSHSEPVNNLPGGCPAVSILSQEHVDWKTVCNGRAMAVKRCIKAQELPCFVHDDSDTTTVLREFAAASKAVDDFLKLLQRTDDLAEIADEYESGMIFEGLLVRHAFVHPRNNAAWDQPRFVAVTHTGSVSLLDTLNVRNATLSRLHAWLKLLVEQYHFVLSFTPSSRENGCFGHIDIYYTTTTLAVAYDTLATVRVLMAPVRPGDTSGSSYLDGLLDSVKSDSSRQSITYAWKSPVARKEQHVDGEVTLDMPGAEHAGWQEVIAETLDSMSVYESSLIAPRTRYTMWFQRNTGPYDVPPLHTVDIPYDVQYVDMQVCVQMHSPVLDSVAETRVVDDVPNQFDSRHPLCDDTKCGDPQRLPVDMHAYDVDDDGTLSTYVVQPSAIINVEYQFHANAFVTFSYNVVAIPGRLNRTMQIFDIRFHSEESVLALNMYEMLLDNENRADTTPQFNAAVRTRAALFGNIGRVAT